MHIDEIDGVPVFWQDAPGPLSAGLVFGCGTRDEAFVTIGVTHLVEHLVMATLPRLHHEHNASVDLCATEFTATGRPEQVVAFLQAVCQGIASPPVDRLAIEAGVLDAEAGFAVHATGAALLTRRFGARDVGLEYFAGPGPALISADAVLRHAARYFVAANAALWLTGPPPPGLRLPLTRGERAQRREPVPLAQDGPLWSQETVPASGLLLSGERDPAASLGLAILGERLYTEARHRLGLSYTIFGDIITTGTRSRQYLLGADARPDRDGEVAGILWREVCALAAAGPSGTELAHEKGGFAEALDDPRWPATEVAERTRSELFGMAYEDPNTWLAEVDAVTPEDVAGFFARAMRTALIAVPDGVIADLPGVGTGGCPRTRVEPAGEVFTMRPLVRILARQWRAPRLYLSATGLAERDADGDVHQTAFSDVVGVEHHTDLRTVFTADGCLLTVVPEAFRGGEALAEAIGRFIPSHLHFPGAGDAGRPERPGELGTIGADTAASRDFAGDGAGNRGAVGSTDGASGAGATVRRQSPGPPGLSTDEVVTKLVSGRPRWYRILNAVGAVVFALLTVLLCVTWRLAHTPLWWAVLDGAVALWCAWDSRPPRRPPEPAAAPETTAPQASTPGAPHAGGPSA